jgi:hypothetical protein
MTSTKNSSFAQVPKADRTRAGTNLPTTIFTRRENLAI